MRSQLRFSEVASAVAASSASYRSDSLTLSSYFFRLFGTLLSKSSNLPPEKNELLPHLKFYIKQKEEKRCLEVLLGTGVIFPPSSYFHLSRFSEYQSYSTETSASSLEASIRPSSSEGRYAPTAVRHIIK